MMKEITLDASAWLSRDDFYDALLSSLGAPAWHGQNLDALNDSIGSDDINTVRLPFRITIADTANLPADLGAYLSRFAELIADLKAEGCDIGLILA